MAELNERSNKVTWLMTWVRVLLPIALAGIGWYIGQTVGNLDERLSAMEQGDTILREEFVDHRSNFNTWKMEADRRLNSQKIVDDQQINRPQYDLDNSNIDRRIERLEDRLQDHDSKQK